MTDRTNKIKKIAEEVLQLEAQTIEKLVGHLDENFAESVDMLYKCKGRVIFTGIGKSGVIAMKIVATLNSTGTPAIFMHSTDAIHGDLGIVQKEDVIVCISKSGNSPELKTLIPYVSIYNNSLIAITSNKDSYLAQNSSKLIYVPIDKEACPNNLAPTTSTTAQLVIGDAIAVCLMKLKGFKSNDFAKYHPGGMLGKQLNLKIKDLMQKKSCPSISKETVLKDIIIEINKHKQGITAVLEQEKIIGAITDGDIRRILETTTTIDKIKAADIMNENPISIKEDILAVEGLNILKQKKVNQLLVINSKNEYTGVIHTLDILKEGFEI